jgi:OHCU decarboxylase
MSALDRINALSEADAYAALLRCCGSTRWAQQMAKKGPYSSVSSLMTLADAIWASLDRSDWLEAFSAHPRIGSKRDVDAKSAATKQWSMHEQAGAAAADDETQRALAQANADYEQKFGRIYLVCATGKSARELLDLCRERLAHDAETELFVAAEEQRKITRLRLEKLLREHQPTPEDPSS